jgi:putative glycerol-1-phosphate prenyltransferase
MINKHIKHLQHTNTKGFAVLLDPDKINLQDLEILIDKSIKNQVTYFFIGGSLITENLTAQIIKHIKKQSTIPIILFPGSFAHIDLTADGILYLSLISGRNADFLIGQHVISAPILRKSNLEILPTGYMLIDGGKQTTVSYISNTTPIPSDKPQIAVCTAMAAEMLGMKLIFMDAGSGAMNAIPFAMIRAVRENVDLPILVGGGIDTIEKAGNALEAGADIIVVGHGIEKDVNLIDKIGRLVRSFNLIQQVENH